MNYLLAGPEEYFKEEFLEKLKGPPKDSTTPGHDLEVMRAGESKAAKVIDASRTLPFASKTKIIIVKDADKFSSDEKKTIVKYLKSPNNSTTLVLESVLSFYRNDFLKEISKYAKLIKCDRPDDKSADAWIKNRFASYNKKISFELTAVIRERSGNDLLKLKNEIEKITTFACEKNEITEKDIEAVLGKSYYNTAFELVDLIAAKKIDLILESLDGLLTTEKPHQLLNVLAWQFRNFLKIKNLPKIPRTDEAMSILRIGRLSAEKLIKQSRHFEKNDLKKKLETLLETDFFIKQGKLTPLHALERAFVKLCD